MWLSFEASVKLNYTTNNMELSSKMFTLEKLKINDGKFSAVDAGEKRRGPLLQAFQWDVPESLKTLSSLDAVEEGWQILLQTPAQYLNTSKISEIVSRSDKEVVFKTQTSTYKLTKD